jgi:hypothetical protein
MQLPMALEQPKYLTRWKAKNPRRGDGVVVQFDKEARLTRVYRGAVVFYKSRRRTARLAQILRYAKTLARDDNQSAPLLATEGNACAPKKPAPGGAGK